MAASRGLNRHFSLLSLLPKPLMQRSSSSGDDAAGGFRKGGSRDSGRLKRFSQQFSLEGASSWQPFEVNDLPVGGVSVWSVCLPACSPRLFGCWCMTWHSSVRMRLCLHVSVRMSKSLFECLCLHEEWCWFDAVPCEFSAMVTPMFAVLPS